MFRMRLDYTFYTKDVVLEDKILDMEKRGIGELQFHWGMLSTAGLVAFPHIHMEVCFPIVAVGVISRHQFRHSTSIPTWRMGQSD